MFANEGLQARPAVVHRSDALQACLSRARSLHAAAETAAEECGRELLRAKEICLHEGRGWYAELARTGIPPRTASRYMKSALRESHNGQQADGGLPDSAKGGAGGPLGDADAMLDAMPAPDDGERPDHAPRVIVGDCAEELAKLEAGSARLVFADPPYNIGIDYGEGEKADRLSDADYCLWFARWIALCRDLLTPDGSLWVLVSDEYAAEYCVALKAAGLTIRNWIKWYETFGVNCLDKFNRTSRHLFYCVKDPKNYVFHREAVTRPSDRQLKWDDPRAKPEGKLWDDVWGVAWGENGEGQIPRVVGNSAERVPGFPTQLPLRLLRPIVSCASDPGDLVVDPFSGSGTTGCVAAALGRRYIGVERSERFALLARRRLAKVSRRLFSA